jgi:RNA polymerase sigma factor (TIGR02999 family)
MNSPSNQATLLLKAWSQGDREALDQLAPLVENELRQLAGALMRKESAGHTLQPTALVNEVYLRLIEWNSPDWQSRAHFFAVSAKMMRRILVNQAVAHQRQKRGGSAVRVSLSEVGGTPDRAAFLSDLDEALLALEQFDSRKSQIVELRFFGGLTAEETAEVLDISLRTVHREWDFARAWLFRELRGKDLAG